ncbi:MAG TPA: hypothetical protein VGG56_02030 [Terracidiphilus sp.]|jgi:hypothetical protein
MTIRSVGKEALLWGTISILLAAMPLRAQQPTVQTPVHVDSDHDGLSDALEQQLLRQFEPKFMMAEHDCSVSPAEFKPDMETPEVEADNGTIYGQVFRAKDTTDHSMVAEIHYYHLWRKDCGSHGHPLDTEHVAVLVRASGADLPTATWKALYWYAAAHENTVCDVSQIARAATLHAEDHGATVWISPGKHASYLNETLCQRGCGADRCENMVPLQPTALINLGEPSHPMNGSLFISSSAWPLMAKMSTSNFPSAPVARLNQLPDTDIAWFNAGRHPAQGVIATSSVTEQAIAESGRNTTAAISLAGNSTGQAISTANGSTGGALHNSFDNTRHALGTAARNVGKALHMMPKNTEEQPH